MPKISNDWINKGAKGTRSEQKNNNMKTGEVFIRPKVGEEVRGRIIGGNIDFVSHWPRIDEGDRDAQGNIVWKNASFPD